MNTILQYQNIECNHTFHAGNIFQCPPTKNTKYYCHNTKIIK